MNKKAASELISYVLVIGLSITLAIAIGLWSRGESERVVKTVVTETETDARCAEVRLGGFMCSRDDNIEVKIKNRGSFSIVGLRYICTDSQGNDVSEKLDLDSPLKPDEEQSLNNIDRCDSSKGLVLTPFIKISDKMIICPEGEKIIDSIEKC